MSMNRISTSGTLLLLALVLPFQGLTQPAPEDPYPLRLRDDEVVIHYLAEIERLH